MNTFARASLVALIALIGFSTSGAAQANSFQITPLRIALSAQKPIVVVTIRNEGDSASVMQLKLVSWSQNLGVDDYQPTQEVMGTPPIFTVPAGGTQIVRVGLRRPPDGRRELAYRLFLEEIPGASDKGEVRVVMRFGIPVFVAPALAALAKSPKPVLEWRVAAAPQQSIRVEAFNRGENHVQVLGFKLLRTQDSTTVLQHKGMDYLLPAQARFWLLTPDQAKDKAPEQLAGTRLKIMAQTDAGDMNGEVAMEP